MQVFKQGNGAKLAVVVYLIAYGNESYPFLTWLKCSCVYAAYPFSILLLAMSERDTRESTKLHPRSSL
jgi:hypothetical protein